MISINNNKDSSQKLTAVILVGGYGTRMRPFTFTTPKPLINFMNEPILERQIRNLKKVDVKRIILCMNYKPEFFEKYVKIFEEKYNLEIDLSIEKKVLGTGGPIGLLKSENQINCETFFVLNADVICENYPFQEMLEHHIKHKKLCTLLTTKVAQPERFGVLKIENLDNIQLIKDFYEKPKTFIGNDINAGIYVFNKKSLDFFYNKPMSVEIDVFPKLSKINELVAFNLQGYWKDVGKPEDYLEAQKYFLNEKEKKKNSINFGVKGKTYVKGKDVIIDTNSKIEDSTIMDGTIINNNVTIKNSIIANNCIINNNVVIINSLIGDDVKIIEGVKLVNVKICPNKKITESLTDQIII